MDYKRFVEEVKKEVRARLEIGMSVSVEKTMKNNGTVLDGLVIRNTGENACPILYLNGYYEEYKDKGSIAECVEDMLKVYKENCIGEEIDLSFAAEWGKVQDKVMCMLINADMNRELLKTVPNREYLDLAVVYYIDLGNSSLGDASIRITEKLIEEWGISEEELYEKALQNMVAYDCPHIENMEDIMRSMMREDIMSDLESDEEADEIQAFLESVLQDSSMSGEPMMYVLTNKKKIKGAACILCKGILDAFARRIGSSFYILPSSINELILVPQKGFHVKEDLQEMVKEVNSTQVAAEEILSDQVYYFDKDKAEVVVA